jgi:hypothetical protein
VTSHPLHDPTERELVAFAGDWELRQFSESDRRFAYFVTKGFAHVQLWHRASGTSIITPSRMTGGNFELFSGTQDLRFAASTWIAIADALDALGVAPPSRHEVRAIERWFVLPNETRAGRLLRSWWAGEAVR